MTTSRGSDLWGGSCLCGCSHQLYGGSIQPPMPWVLPPISWGWEPPYPGCRPGEFWLFGPCWAPFGTLLGHGQPNLLGPPAGPPAWYVVDPGVQFAAGNFGFLGPAGPHLVHCLGHEQPSLLGPPAWWEILAFWALLGPIWLGGLQADLTEAT
ncbi:hypothetical protein C8R44DRAFT_754059 [Mycena epipterygia]|nr:hypothetical protein C8R44DRAFT_754059 [Mycena epipterygia]